MWLKKIIVRQPAQVTWKNDLENNALSRVKPHDIIFWTRREMVRRLRRIIMQFFLHRCGKSCIFLFRKRNFKNLLSSDYAGTVECIIYVVPLYWYIKHCVHYFSSTQVPTSVCWMTFFMRSISQMPSSYRAYAVFQAPVAIELSNFFASRRTFCEKYHR